MIKTAMISMLASASLLFAGCSNPSDKSDMVSFPILNPQSASIGTLTLKPHARGGIEIKVKVEGLEPGTRAMHFHEIGSCVAPDFKSAGGHFNPAGVSHGQVANGPHAGDMMNVEVGADGKGVFKLVNEKVSIDGTDLPALMDANGSALIIHAKADDYTSQPTGAAGPRAACAVINQ